MTSSLRVERNDGKYYVFDISISNNSNRYISIIDISKIYAEIYSNNGKKFIKVNALNKSEYLKIKKRRNNLRKGLLILAQGMASMNDNYSYAEQNTYTSGNFSGSIYSGIDRTDFRGDYSGSTYSVIKYYDPQKAEAARERNAEVMRNFVNKSNQSKEKTNTEYLNNVSLFSMGITSGLVNVPFYKTKNMIILNIPVGNNNFKFEWYLK